MSQLNESTSGKSLTTSHETTHDGNQLRDNTTINRSNSLSEKRKALNISNNCNNSKLIHNKRLRIDSEDFETDPKMSENTIAVNNQNNRYSISPNGVNKSSQLSNNTKPGTAKKLIIKNFGQSEHLTLITVFA